MRSFVLPLLYTISLIHNTLSDDDTQAIDTFYDEGTDSTWIILSGEVMDDFASKWDSNEKWDTINENIETQKDHYITRKCENIFGNSLCLCQFQKLTKIHNCHRNGQAETKKQQYLRNAYASHHNKNPYNYNNDPQSAAARMLPSNIRTHPLFNRFWNNNNPKSLLPQVQSDTRQEKLFSLKEQKIENEIAAAKIEAATDELEEEEIDEIEDEIDDLIEEEQEFEEDKEMENILQDDELIDTDTDTDTDMDTDEIDAEILENDVQEYNDEIADVLNEEVKTESELIEKQNVLIEELKQDNAMKEELIEVLEEEEDEDEYDDEEEDSDMDTDTDVEDDFAGEEEWYDDDNDDEAVDVDAGDEEYYDNEEVEDELAQEDYDELYDVDGENDEDDDAEFEEADEAKDLEKKEKEAMIADTFWGLEIYSIAFMVLCCCCISCYMQKTKCCGYCVEEDKTFAYSQYHQQGGFKRVFGNVDDDYEQEDVEMGVEQNNSDEQQALHS